MPLQSNPFILGAILLVAVGTAIYTYWTTSNRKRNSNYSYDSKRDNQNPSQQDVPDDDENRRRRRNRCEECICLRSLERNVQTPTCGHSFHTQSIRSWLVEKNNCPNCRQDIQ